jgi:hypothetical protein
MALSGPGASSWGPNRLDVFVAGPDAALWIATGAVLIPVDYAMSLST